MARRPRPAEYPPQFDASQFEATYEYPAYMRKPTDKGTGSSLRAYRGTKITLVAKTNREVKDGTMTFDYRVRPGVVTKSNALELMRAVGLEV